MPQVPVVGQITSAGSPQVRTPFNRASEILGDFTDVLHLKTDGETGKIKIVRKLDAGQVKPLSDDQLTKLPEAIAALETELSNTVHPDSLALLRSLISAQTFQTQPALSDTATFRLGITRAEINIAAAVTEQTAASNPNQVIADEILQTNGFSEYGIKVYVKPCKTQVKDKPTQYFVTFTSDEKNVIPNSKKPNLGTVLKEIAEKLEVEKIAYGFNSLGSEDFTIKESSL